LLLGAHNSEITFFINFYALFLGSKQNLKNLTAKWILVESPLLQHFLDIAELAKIKFSLSVKRLIIHLELLNLLMEDLRVFGRGSTANVHIRLHILSWASSSCDSALSWCRFAGIDLS
jgi:hypothetical protein